ncbi:MAG: helix-turn-helix transcriptional regulator [Candidatus Nealsonbacteria bacterium]|nr:helix-turn-helix transcriptional regulator [Candidatus Nealsonbacteria bacterium]
MPDYTRENLLRLMAGGGLSIHQVAGQTGLDQRTIRGLLAGENKPRAATIHRLAGGLGVPVEEFFVDPAQLLCRHLDRHFDRQTNPIVEEVLQDRGELFTGWTEADFDELHSRMGTGGGLTREGTIAAAEGMNHKRDLHRKLDLLLETSHADLIGGMIDAAYERAAVEEG